MKAYRKKPYTVKRTYEQQRTLRGKRRARRLKDVPDDCIRDLAKRTKWRKGIRESVRESTESFLKKWTWWLFDKKKDDKKSGKESKSDD